MTAASQSSQFPFDFVDFAPRSTQDSELLQQLSFVPGLKDLLLVRQVHALEHATVWVLSEQTQTAASFEPVSQTWKAMPSGLTGGMSTHEGFYLYGTVPTAALRGAVYEALRRLVSGEWNLAVHPQCGTNLSVGMLLTAGLTMGAFLALPKGPIEQLLGLGLAASTAMYLAPEVGSLVQRYVTTAIPFNLAIQEISRQDRSGQPVHFVRVRWIEP